MWAQEFYPTALWCDHFSSLEGGIIRQVRHGSATTTHALRAAIQRSQVSLAQLSEELGISAKTVAKWQNRQSVKDRKARPRKLCLSCSDVTRCDQHSAVSVSLQLGTNVRFGEAVRQHRSCFERPVRAECAGSGLLRAVPGTRTGRLT